MTGIDDPYEAPESPDLVLDTISTTAEENARLILEQLRRAGFLGDGGREASATGA